MTRALRGARLIELGLIPVVRAPMEEGALALARALFEGGVRCLEITFTVPGATQVIATLRRELGPEALVGAGTVTSAEEAERALAAGAEFLVSPGCLPELVPLAGKAEVPALLGALTPTEIVLAERTGADFIKVFPASALGGAAYIKTLRGPFPNARFVPTGGVTLQTLASYLEAGAVALGVGTALADYELLRAEGTMAVVELARRYQEELSRARSRSVPP